MTDDVINQAARAITANWLTRSPLKMAQALAEAGLLAARPTAEAKPYTAGGGRNPTSSTIPATLEVDGEAGAWYVRILDEPVAQTTEQPGPVNVDWTRDGRMVGVEILPAEDRNR